MKKRHTLCLVFGLLALSLTGQIPFNGHTGLYLLGTTDQPIPSADFAKPFVDGAAVRVRWSALETSPGEFNWTFLDGELAKASDADKKISISILGNPDWLEDLSVQQYHYIDQNPNHPTFGDTLPDYIPWDLRYLQRVQMLNQQLGARYADNPVVTYCNSIAGFFSRNLPAEDVLTSDGWQPIWQSFGYHPDTIVARMKVALDTYMAAFPHTAQWNSMDYQSFEPAATGHAKNYISQQYAVYGLAAYPDRFGVWREDLAGCNPGPNVQTGSQWYPVIQNPCRNGAQMLWNVQDGPTRMNHCGILPNTEAAVLDSAINRGIALGMRYMEIYKVDMEDVGLESTLLAARQRLLTAAAGACQGASTGLPNLPDLVLTAWPNPSNGHFNIRLMDAVQQPTVARLFDRMGRRLAEQAVTNTGRDLSFDFSGIPAGIYCLTLVFENGNLFTTRLVVTE